MYNLIPVPSRPSKKGGPTKSGFLNTQSSKYLHSYNILLVKYFYSKTKCGFVFGGGDSKQGVPGGNKTHGPCLFSIAMHNS